MIELILGAWAVWVAFVVTSYLLGVLFMERQRAPCCDGMRVHIPDWVPFMLTSSELAAVVAHERGHMHYMHVWTNLALLCVFVWPSKERRRAQEWQADDYAARAGHAKALASAILKLGCHPDDVARADRLGAK
ncbi:MAG: hypothetical protein V4857_14330 [Pseudomonadota bacterium]